MTWIDIIAYSIGGALLLLMSIAIAFSAVAPALKEWNRKYLIALFSLQLVSVVLCFLDAILYERPDMAILERVNYVLGFIFLLPLMVMPTIFLLHQAGEDVVRSPIFIAAIALSAVYYGFVITAQFTDAFYSVTAEASFVRGPLFPLLASPHALITLLNIFTAFIKRKKIKKRYFVASMVYLPPLAGALIAHMFVSFEFFVLLGVGLWAITILALAMQENMTEYLRQQREIANQKASILVLQMRPHFIYNTMTSIYYLCDQDPAKAKQVTLDFTTYLRKNFAAIASGDTIPFADELEHTKAYLAVEKAQFEDVLFVEFDTPHTLFRLPPLTLQPIVENAVKHGMVNSKEPIHIRVSTRLTDKSNEIIVEDDGPGFLHNPVGNSPHIALENIRARLEMMCKGNLEITFPNSGGTTVTVSIPLSKHASDLDLIGQ